VHSVKWYLTLIYLWGIKKPPYDRTAAMFCELSTWPMGRVIGHVLHAPFGVDAKIEPHCWGCYLLFFSTFVWPSVATPNATNAPMAISAI